MNLIKDLFDREILKYTFFPLILSLLFWGVVFFIFGDEIVNLFLNLTSALPYSDKISAFIEGAGWVFLGLLYYLLTISTLGVFSSFFVDKIVLRINKKHYNCMVKKVGLKESLRGVFVSVKSFLLYLVIFIFTFWVLFIPVVNVIYQLIMWSILNKAPLEFDSSYLFEVKKRNIWWVVFVSSFIYFIPFISWFGYTIQLIFVTHYMLRSCK